MSRDVALWLSRIMVTSGLVLLGLVLAWWLLESWDKWRTVRRWGKR